MSDDYHGDAEPVVDIADKRENGLRCLRVKRARCLVAEQYLRVGRQRAGNSHSLLLAARELRRVALELVAETDDLEQLGRSLDRLGLFDPRKLQREADVSETVPLHEQVEALEYHRDIPALLPELILGERAHVAPVDYDLALGRALEHIDAAHKSALACAAHADDAVYLAVLYLERDIVQGVEIAIGGGERLS